MYKTKLCSRGPHPLQDYCPDAHQESELRDVSGYLVLLQPPSEPVTIDEIEKPVEMSEEITAEISIEEQKQEIKRQINPSFVSKMKKSVSMLVTDEGGMEAEIESQKIEEIQNTKNKNKRKKNKSKSKGNNIQSQTNAI